MMKALAKTGPAYEVVCDSKIDRDAWLLERRKGIGASEAIRVIKQKHLTIYADKVGRASEKPQTEAMHMGHRLEPLTRELYSERTGRPTRVDGLLYRSTKYPWAMTTLDAWTEIDGVPRILEQKAPGAHMSEQWLDGAPEAAWWQVQHQMLVLDEPVASVCALIGGQQFVWCDVERDDDALAQYVKIASDLWSRIERRSPPPPDASNDAKDALGLLYPTDDGSEVVLPGAFLELDAELCDLKDRRKGIDRRITEIENLIKAELGDATKAWLPDGTGYSWKTQHKAETVIKATSFRVLRRHASKEQ